MFVTLDQISRHKQNPHLSFREMRIHCQHAMTCFHCVWLIYEWIIVTERTGYVNELNRLPHCAILDVLLPISTSYNQPLA